MASLGYNELTHSVPQQGKLHTQLIHICLFGPNQETKIYSHLFLHTCPSNSWTGCPSDPFMNQSWVSTNQCGWCWTQNILGELNQNHGCWCAGDIRSEREIKFIGLFGDRGHRGPYGPYKPCNHNLYIGIIIFLHIDNPQSTGYN